MPTTNASRIFAHGKRFGLQTTQVQGISAGSARAGFVVTARELQHRFDFLVDATESATYLRESNDKLLNVLIRRGLITPSAYGGIKVDFATGQVAQNSRIYAIGPITRGTHFYTNSIETIAHNARKSAEHIVHMTKSD